MNIATFFRSLIQTYPSIRQGTACRKVRGKRRRAEGATQVLECLESRTLLAVITPTGESGNITATADGYVKEAYYDENGDIQPSGYEYDLYVSPSTQEHSVSYEGGTGAGVYYPSNFAVEAINLHGLHSLSTEGSSHVDIWNDLLVIERTLSASASFSATRHFRLDPESEEEANQLFVLLTSGEVTNVGSGSTILATASAGGSSFAFPVGSSEHRFLIRAGDTITVSVSGSSGASGGVGTVLSTSAGGVVGVAVGVVNGSIAVSTPLVGDDDLGTGDPQNATFGPYLAGVPLQNRFDVALQGLDSDILGVVSSVKWAIDGVGGNASPVGTGKQKWQFTTDMKNYAIGEHNLTITAYGPGGTILAKYENGKIVQIDPSLLNFELNVDPGAASDFIDIEDARFVTGVSTPLKYEGTIPGLPKYYDSLLTVKFGSAAPTSPGALSFTAGNNEDGEFHFQYDTQNVPASNPATVQLQIGNVRIGDTEPLIVVASPTWISSGPLKYDTTQGQYVALNAKFTPLSKTVSFAQTQYDWINQKLAAYDSTARLEAEFNLKASLNWTDSVSAPIVDVQGMTAKLTLLGKPVYDKKYTPADLDLSGVAGHLNSKTLQPNGLSFSLKNFQTKPVSFFDRTFNFDLIQVPEIIEDLVHARVQLGIKIAGSMGLDGAGFSLSTQGNQVVCNPEGTFFSVNVTPTASVTAALDAKLFVVSANAAVTGTATLPINVDLHFGGPASSIPDVKSGKFTVRLDFGYHVDVVATLAKTFTILDYHSGPQSLGSLKLVDYTLGTSSLQSTPTSVTGTPPSSPSDLFVGPLPAQNLILPASTIDDHGNTSAIATPVTLESYTPGELESAGDTDFFSFPVSTGRRYQILLDVQDLSASEFTLFDQDGIVPLEIVDSEGGPATIFFTARKTATLFASVKSTDPAMTGIYYFSFAEVTPEGVTTLAVNTTTSGDLEDPFLPDFYRFVVVAGKQYRLRTTLGTLQDSTLELLADVSSDYLDYGGFEQLGYSDDANDGFGSEIIFTAPKTGWLYATVGSFSGTWTGTYDLSLETLTPVTIPDDHGNTTSNATSVTASSLTNGNLEKAGDVDLFKVPLTVGNTYRFHVSRQTLANAQLSLFGTNGTTLLETSNDWSGSADAEILYRPTVSGNYYVQAAGPFGPETGTYQLEIANGDDHGNTSAAAATVLVGSTTDGKLKVLSDVDYFKFSVVSGKTYVLESNLGTLSDSVLTLFNSNGTTILDSNDDNGTDQGSRIQFTATSTGLLYAKVASYSGTDLGTYHLKLTELGDPADDFGNTSATAAARSFNSTTDGSLEKVADKDLFKFTVVAGKTYSFETILGTLYDSTITLYDANGTTQLDFNDDSGIGATLGSRLIYTPTTSGVRYLAVGSYNQQTNGSYQLLAKEVLNNAPALDSTGNPVLTPIAEDVPNAGNPGTLISQIIASMGSGAITDVDPGAKQGIAITVPDQANGTWQFTTNGTNWANFGALSVSNALLLASDATTRVRFIPNANFNGTSKFTFVAWDQTAGTNGSTTTAASRGGNKPFSSDFDTAIITITAVNDAPVLNKNGSPVLTSISQNVSNAANPGTLVSQVIASMAPQGSITDVDANAKQGIAIYGANATNGNWQYTTNGSTWVDFATINVSNGLLLASDAKTRIRFVPKANFIGTAGINFVAWDQTTGTNGSKAALTNTGNSTAFSSSTETALITVQAVNTPAAIGIVRNGGFYLDANNNGTWNSAADAYFTFGNSTDTPLAGDWNGDGKTDIGVFRNGTFFLDLNGSRKWESASDVSFAFGNSTDKPITGDWNADGKTDIGTFRNGTFFLDANGSRKWEGTSDVSFAFGNATDLPVTGDWNADGKTDVGTFRNGSFFLDYNGSRKWEGATDKVYNFGIASDKPIAGNWGAVSAPAALVVTNSVAEKAVEPVIASVSQVSGGSVRSHVLHQLKRVLRRGKGA